MACACALALTAAPARAQWVADHSTNTFPQHTQGDTSTPSPAAASNGTVGASCYADATADTTDTGTVTLTFRWTGAQGQAVTPLSVLVNGSATLGGLEPVSPTVSDGLGDPTVTQTEQGFPWPISYASGGLHLVQMPAPQGAGPGTLLSLSPYTLTASGTEGDGNVILSGTVTSYSATITPSGATQDSNGNWDILVGQYFRPSLSLGSAPGCTVSNPQWTVTGTTFQSWNIGPNQSSAAVVPGPGPLNGPIPQASPPVPAPSWYWDEAAATETVSCTATVTPPAGAGAAFTVTATQKVNVVDPYFGAQAIEVGTVGFDFTNPIFPVVTSGGTNSEGTGFSVNGGVGTPSLFSAEGSGSWGWLQLCNLNRTYTDVTGTHPVAQTNGYELDSAFPYNTVAGQGDTPGTPISAGIDPKTGNAYFSNFSDTPDMTMSPIAYYYSIGDFFKLHIMYLPPNGGTGSNWVPLTAMYWGWGGSLTRNSGSSWPNSSPGTVDFYGYQNNPPYPLWTQTFLSGS